MLEGERARVLFAASKSPPRCAAADHAGASSFSRSLNAVWNVPRRGHGRPVLSLGSGGEGLVHDEHRVLAVQLEGSARVLRTQLGLPGGVEGDADFAAKLSGLASDAPAQAIREAAMLTRAVALQVSGLLYSLVARSERMLIATEGVSPAAGGGPPG